MKCPPDTFETSRLEGRRSRLSDAPAIFAAYAADPAVTRFLTWRTYGEAQSLAEYLKSTIAAWEAGASYRYELCLRGTDLPLGSIELRPESGRMQFGYVLARAYWGRGLMAEALRFAADWALAQPDAFRAYAFCDVENTPSARVMEKAGMVREGVLRRWHICPNLGPEPRDCFIYARVR